MEILAGFGKDGVHLITLYIEHISRDLSLVMHIRTILHANVSFYLVIGNKFVNMLDIETETDEFPKWLTFSIDELKASVEQKNLTPRYTSTWTSGRM
jgi:hypothetical protein